MKYAVLARPGIFGASITAFDDTAARKVPGVRDAVSYTHLRAHETVLDLVCRLLLEKKNDTVPNNLPSI